MSVCRLLSQVTFSIPLNLSLPCDLTRKAAGTEGYCMFCSQIPKSICEPSWPSLFTDEGPHRNKRSRQKPMLNTRRWWRPSRPHSHSLHSGRPQEMPSWVPPTLLPTATCKWLLFGLIFLLLFLKIQLMLSQSVKLYRQNHGDWILLLWIDQWGKLVFYTLARIHSFSNPKWQTH